MHTYIHTYIQQQFGGPAPFRTEFAPSRNPSDNLEFAVSSYWHVHVYIHIHIYTALVLHIYTSIQLRVKVPRSKNNFRKCAYACTNKHAYIHAYIHKYIHTTAIRRHPAFPHWVAQPQRQPRIRCKCLTRIRIRGHACAYVCIYVSLNSCMIYVWRMYTYVCVHTWEVVLWLGKYVCVCVCVCVLNTYTRVCLCMHTHTYIYHNSHKHMHMHRNSMCIPLTHVHTHIHTYAAIQGSQAFLIIHLHFV